MIQASAQLQGMEQVALIESSESSMPGAGTQVL